ncbi:MAG: hypothetical protein AABZ39_06245 [Spirochaetota bacterium]
MKKSILLATTAFFGCALISCIDLNTLGHTNPYDLNGVNGGFKTNTVPGLSMWFKPDAGITLSGSDVTSWADQSGNGYHLTGTSPTKPTFENNIINGIGAVRFGQAEVRRLYRDTTPTLQIPSTTFVVMKATGTATENFQCVYNAKSDNYFKMLRLNAAPSTAFGIYDNLSLAGGNLANVPQLWIGVHNGASSKVYLNDGTPATGDAGNSTGNTGFVVGSDHNGNYGFYGYIAEVLVYTGALSASNISVVKDYLNRKYAIY